MPMLTDTLRALIVSALAYSIPVTACAKEHRVQMLNAATDNAQHTNVFAPMVLHIALGDTVTFVPGDKGHNTASKRGMIPEGAEPWNSPMNELFSVTPSVPGVYGYICVPHYEMGMVGLIVVGDDPGNMQAAKKVRHPGAARAVFRDLLRSVDTIVQH